MKPFLKWFCVEEGNGLSPFAVDMDSPAELIKLIKYFPWPPNEDLQENPKTENPKNPYDNGDSEEDDDANHACGILPEFVNNTQSLDLDKDK